MASEPVELTNDPAFARRVIRLALTSSIALGLVWILAIVTLDAHPSVGASLALGWLLMPSILFLSLRRPRLRYALAIPSALVGVPLLIICASNLPEELIQILDGIPESVRTAVRSRSFFVAENHLSQKLDVHAIFFELMPRNN